MRIGWLTCIPAVLLPHSPCRFTTANAPANRQMPIASVVMRHSKKKKNNIYIMIKTYVKDIIGIGISVLIIFISFLPIENFISHEIPILKVIWIWDKLDIYSLVLI